MGQFKWLAVVSPEEPQAAELLLEPSDNPAAQTFKKALFDHAIAAAAFAVDDIHAEYARLSGLGVDFSIEPIEMGSTIVALIDDTCGNLIQMYQA